MMKSISIIVVLIACVLISCAAVAETKAWGWRGDGTGLFPDVDPPVKWDRISETMKGLRTQAEKPKGEGPGSAKPIPYGIVNEWLILGPVAAEGKFKELREKELVPDEAKLQPDAGDRVGKLEWKVVRVGGALLYLNNSLGDLTDKAAYVHTYIYAPEKRWVILRVKSSPGSRGTSPSIWLNGTQLGVPQRRHFYRLQLNQGWNRLLARAISIRKTYGYGENDLVPAGTAYFQLEMYGGEWEEAYRENGILWAVETPQAGHFSVYQPVIVGDRVYVTSSPAFLMCYDKHTGKRLWMRYNGFCEFITAEEREKFPDLFKEIDPKAKRFRALAESYRGASGDCWELEGLQKELIALLKKVDRKKYAFKARQEPGLISQPITDGKFIYTWCFHGIAACYDLDGNRKWMTLENEGPHWKHGYLQAPLLIGDDMVVEMGSIIGFDRKTGKINWKIPHKSRFYHHLGTKVVERSENTDHVNYHGVGVYKPGLGFFPWSTTTTRYGNTLYRRTKYRPQISRLPEPLTGPPPLKEEVLSAVRMPGEPRVIVPGIHWGGATCILANVLVHDGLIYTISTGGVLRVTDAATLKLVFIKRLDLNPIMWAWPYPHGAGVCASPTLAGKYIYLFGSNGMTLVIKPGRTPEVIARNRIERLLPGRMGGGGVLAPRDGNEDDRYPECTMSSPIFDGKRLYYRAERYLYCIGEK